MLGLQRKMLVSPSHNVLHFTIHHPLRSTTELEEFTAEAM